MWKKLTPRCAVSSDFTAEIADIQTRCWEQPWPACIWRAGKEEKVAIESLLKVVTSKGWAHSPGVTPWAPLPWRNLCYLAIKWGFPLLNNIYLQVLFFCLMSLFRLFHHLITLLVIDMQKLFTVVLMLYCDVTASLDVCNKKKKNQTIMIRTFPSFLHTVNVGYYVIYFICIL